MSAVRDFLKRLVVEGSRVFWTAVEAGAGIVGTRFVLPDAAFEWAGDYAGVLTAASVVAIAAVVTAVKEFARARIKRNAIPPEARPPEA